MHARNRGLIWSLAAAAMFMTGQTSAGPVALAVDLTGSTEPAIELYDELESGQRYTLADDARIEFLHYPSCQTVVVQGGDLSFSMENFRVRGGEIVDVQRTRCPETIRLAAEGEVAALTVRGGDPDRLRLHADAGFVLVGPGAEDLNRIAIYRGDEPVYAGDLPGPKFTWPEDREPPEPGADYRIELSGPGRPEALGFAAEIDQRRGAGPVAVVRVD